MYTLFEKPFFVLGHRGYSEKYPENTMLSFEQCAKDPRIDGVELDVHLCKSGEIVVAHDGNLSRCAGLNKYIEDMNWDELKDLDVGSFKGPEFSNCRMPLLSELFEKFADRFAYDIEIKVEKGRRFKKLCRKLWNLICEYNLQEKVMISSFNPFALRYFNRICMMSVPTADIYDDCESVPKNLRYGWGHNISKSSYSKPAYHLVDESFLDKLGLEVIAWTVNDDQEALRLSKLHRVKGLIGNNPEMLAEIKEKK